MQRLSAVFATLVGLGLLGAGAGYAPPASAATHVSVGIGIGMAPPPPRFERMPPARRGYVWAPGYWRPVARTRHVTWVGGRWIRARPGRDYRQTAWVHDRRAWRFQPGGWGR